MNRKPIVFQTTYDTFHIVPLFNRIRGNSKKEYRTVPKTVPRSESMQRVKRSPTTMIQLFSKDELYEIEQLRKETYNKYEKDNPQFAQENYDSWKKNNIEGGQASTTISKRSLWALVGYDYSVANNCIKDFTSSGDLKYILHAIDVLWTKAFQSPVITNIILSLNNKYSLSLWVGEKKTSKYIENFFEAIGTNLLFDNPQIVKPHKSRLVLRKLQTNLSNRFNKQFSIEDTLKHILKIYSDIRSNLKKEPAFKPDANQKEMIKNNKRVLKKTKDRLHNTSNEKQLQDLKNDLRNIENIIKDLNAMEDKIYKEARKRTIKYIQEETNIKLGSTNFKLILSLANKINPT